VCGDRHTPAPEADQSTHIDRSLIILMGPARITLGLHSSECRDFIHFRAAEELARGLRQNQKGKRKTESLGIPRKGGQHVAFDSLDLPRDVIAARHARPDEAAPAGMSGTGDE
jgi:hypothetical protein